MTTHVDVASDRDLIQMAMRRRAALADEIARLDAFIRTADELEQGGGIEDMPAELRQELATIPAGPARPAGVVEAAEDALRAVGRPLTRGELFERLRSSGVRIDGTDPVKNMGTMLWRSGRFDNAGRRYWLSGEPRPGDRADPGG